MTFLPPVMLACAVQNTAKSSAYARILTSIECNLKSFILILVKIFEQKGSKYIAKSSGLKGHPCLREDPTGKQALNLLLTIIFELPLLYAILTPSKITEPTFTCSKTQNNTSWATRSKAFSKSNCSKATLPPVASMHFNMLRPVCMCVKMVLRLMPHVWWSQTMSFIAFSATLPVILWKFYSRHLWGWLDNKRSLTAVSLDLPFPGSKQCLCFLKTKAVLCSHTLCQVLCIGPPLFLTWKPCRILRLFHPAQVVFWA